MHVLPIVLVVLALCGPALAQDLTAARFRLGMAAMELAQRSEPERRDALLEKAIAAFRAILVKQPELVRVRLELAPRLLPQGGGSAGAAAFRAGPGRQPAGRGGAQRQPVPGPDPRAQALEPARRRGDAARHQYRRGLGRADHLYPLRRPAAAVPPRPGGAHHLGNRALGLARAASTSCRSAARRPGRARASGGCARAATSRAGNTARAGSTG